MKYRLRQALLGLALAALSCAAGAQQIAFTAKPVNLRAGPDRAYPIVAVLPPNAEVLVQGCMPDYRWCDVSFGYERGWAYAGNLRTTWGERLLPLPNVAPLVGIVVLSFGIDYWDLHYRDRPWYPQRYRWAHPYYHVAPRPAPPPPLPGPVPHVRPPAARIHPPPQVQPAPPAPVPHVRPPAARIHPPPQVQPAPRQVQPVQPAPRPAETAPRHVRPAPGQDRPATIEIQPPGQVRTAPEHGHRPPEQARPHRQPGEGRGERGEGHRPAPDR